MIGWIEEVPGVNAQERTKEELMASLREVLKEALEFNRQDAEANSLRRVAAEPDEGLVDWLLACPEKGFFKECLSMEPTDAVQPSSR